MAAASCTFAGALQGTALRGSPLATRPQVPGNGSIRSLPGRRVGRSQVSVTASADRPLWLPGSTSPSHLDGSLAGDFGFDPLSLGAEKEDLRWYVQAELVHCRWAMLGVAGILFTDLLRVSEIDPETPVWWEAGAAFEADAATLFWVQMVLMGFAESKRWADFVKPGSQAEEDSFFGVEPFFEGLANGYPGGFLFNPLGLANGATEQPMRLKEIKNGRLAMLAMLGFFVQAKITGQSPLENLGKHLADPFHSTVIQTLSLQ